MQTRLCQLLCIVWRGMYLSGHLCILDIEKSRFAPVTIEADLIDVQVGLVSAADVGHSFRCGDRLIKKGGQINRQIDK